MMPDRARERGQPLERRHQDFENRVPQRKRPVEGEHRAGQRERGDDEAHQRDCERVGDRRDERHLLEQHEEQRSEARGDRPLHPSPLREPVGLGGATGGHEENHCDRGERKPEARREDRPGVEREDDEERRGEHARGARRPAEPERDCDHADHVKSALRGNRESGNEAIGERGEKAGERRGFLRGQGERESLAAPPAPGHEHRKEARHHGDVKTRDGHQVAHSGAGEELPLPRVDRVLVADRERDQDARVGALGQCAADSFARGLAQALDPVSRPRHHRRETLGRDLRALIACAARGHSHVAGRANAALEEPGLVIESVRVGAAVRPAQPHREAPALPGAHREDALGIVRGESAVGREHDAPRHACLGRFHVEIEAHASLEGLRQAGDDAADKHIAPLQLRIQAVRDPQLREHRGPGETEGGEADEGRAGSDDGRNAAGESDRSDCGEREIQRQPPHPRQLGLVLQQPHPEREPQRGKSHRRLGALFIPRLTARGPGG